MDKPFLDLHDLNVILIFITAVVATATAYAAWAAGKAAKSTGDALRADLIWNIRQRYEADEMGQDMKNMAQYVKDYRNKRDLLNPNCWDDDHRRARRHIYQYFNTVTLLHEQKLITDEIIKSLFSQYAIEGVFENIYPLARIDDGYMDGTSPRTTRLLIRLFPQAYEKARNAWGTKWVDDDDRYPPDG